ncbi:MAG: hypothetical protein FWF22_04285 [Treponema sp.]|nr:hypothetical protein [Treponema sp.]
MRSKIIGFVIGLTVLGTGLLIFFNFFEIADYDKDIPPSKESEVNQYLALDRWLQSNEFSVRTQNDADLETLKAAPENIILIQSNLVDWNNEIIAWLDRWVRNGGVLILCLDYYRSWNGDDPLGIYLEKIGLGTWQVPEGSSYSYSRAPDAVYFSRNIIFSEPHRSSLVLRDENNFIRLVQVKIGRGQITVTGRPSFMLSSQLEREANARLSWYLFAGPAVSDKSVLFVRGTRRSVGIFGRFFQRGNFSLIITSCLFLIAVGFWTAIPMFGVARSGEKEGRALAERFLAEGRFFRRYKSLDVYRAAYLKEIRRKLAGRKKCSDDEIIERAALVWAGGVPEVTRAFRGELKQKDDFLKSIVILKTILERI